MKFTLSKEVLTKGLQPVVGVIERKQTKPVLANVFIELDDSGKRLQFVGSDSEVEIVSYVVLEESGLAGRTTVPAKKLWDICRSLSDDSKVDIKVDQNVAIVSSRRSQFTLSTLPAEDFPKTENSIRGLQFECPQSLVKYAINKTSFAMAQNDVRYYLNGMLFEIQTNNINFVATDGHRLAMCKNVLNLVQDEKIQAILPKKGVNELSRLLEEDETQLKVSIDNNHIRVENDNFTFTSKLIDGKYPDYEKALPIGGGNILYGKRDILKSACARVGILANEKYRGVRLTVEDGVMTLVANNPEQEEAQEILEVDQTGDRIQTGFNISYLVDVLTVLDTDAVKISLTDSDSSALIEEVNGESTLLYVVMPMRL